MYRMVYYGDVPAEPEDLDAVQLGPEHAEAALELALLTHPGPFGIRTIELGEYFGCFEGSKLIAMAGERIFAGNFREISGVCTHPDFQGRGFARKLMAKLIRREALRGETSFLHVVTENELAHGLYTRMGFRIHSEPVMRVFSKA